MKMKSVTSLFLDKQVRQVISCKVPEAFASKAATLPATHDEASVANHAEAVNVTIPGKLHGKAKGSSSHRLEHCDYSHRA